MKKYKNVIITVLIAIVAIVGVFFLSKLGEDKYFREISYSDYESLIKTNNSYIYVGSKDNNESFVAIKNLAIENELEFKYLYTESLTDEQKEKLLGDKEEVIIYIKDKKIDTFSDKIDALSVTSYLISKKVLPKTFITIDINKYLELIKGENQVVVLGRTGCSYCEMFQPVINNVMSEYDIDIYYVNIYDISEEDYNNMVAATPYLSENEWGTPTTFIFNNGEIKGVQSGYSDAPEFAKFLKQYGVIK